MTARATMPRPKSQNDSVTSLTLPGAWLDEAEHLADRMRQPGMSGLTRADVLRMALRRGLDALDAEYPETKSRKR